MSFTEAIQNSPEISECLKDGLQALGSNSTKVSVSLTRDLEGSVDIDACLQNIYPNESRWDYVLGYKNRIYYVEVHPAITGEVKRVIEKLNWLKRWREQKASNLEALHHRSTYHWIASGKVAISRRSRYARELARHGISNPNSRLRLD